MHTKSSVFCIILILTPGLLAVILLYLPVTFFMKYSRLGVISTTRSVLLIFNLILGRCYGTGSTSSASWAIPKVELHAHLHGSIRTNTLIELAHEYRTEAALLLESNRDIHKCFGIFDLIHRTISNKETVRRVVREVLEDFMHENVVYLELRTTPRAVAGAMSIDEYLESVLSVIEEHNSLYGNRMLTRLLLSIDRGKAVHDNRTILSMALKYQKKFTDIIVGIDLSGNPLKGNVVDELLPILQQCREAGFRITMHAAEVPELDYPCELSSIESRNLSTAISMNGARNCISNGYISPTSSVGEISAMIAFRPERFGHALFLHDHHVLSLLELHEQGRAPIIEICPTSNMYTLNLTSYEQHPTLGTWIELGYPVAISTDDTGVFNTTLSQEYLRVQESFNLSISQLICLAAQPIDYIFASDDIKERVREMFDDRLVAVSSLPLLSSSDHFDDVGSSTGTGAVPLIKRNDCKSSRVDNLSQSSRTTSNELLNYRNDTAAAATAANAAAY